MSSFVLALFACVAAWAAETMKDQAQSTRYDHGVVTMKIGPLFGGLASILLLMIVFPVLGWVTLFLWALYFSKCVYELVKDEFLELFDTLNAAIHGQFIPNNEDHDLPV
ncbi:hypothetical protein TIFTF001_025072 [Ficus carica]|uniref:Uncharacterized protein n=1 Tax=Ficus carica TaxID=3494 RepID=A0AA88AN47_FICCA|nr:hypothetical protein TIFTF001_025072 [Ficus carica]